MSTVVRMNESVHESAGKYTSPAQCPLSLDKKGNCIAVSHRHNLSLQRCGLNLTPNLVRDSAHTVVMMWGLMSSCRADILGTMRLCDDVVRNALRCRADMLGTMRLCDDVVRNALRCRADILGTMRLCDDVGLSGLTY